MELTWSNIDWDKHRLTIIAEKTGRRRVVPIPVAIQASHFKAVNGLLLVGILACSSVNLFVQSRYHARFSLA